MHTYDTDTVTKRNNQGELPKLPRSQGGTPNGEEAYKILYPLGGRPTPSGCTGVDQSEEQNPSDITLYGYTNAHQKERVKGHKPIESY